MALTIYSYKYDKSYILEESSSKVKIDFSLAKSFKRDYIMQSGDHDMVNIIFAIFERDDNYNTRLGIKDNVLNKLGIKEIDFDFLVLAENESGVDLNYFYKAEYINQILTKIEENKAFLFENTSISYPECIIGVAEGIDFSKKAIEEGDLMLFWFDY